MESRKIHRVGASILMALITLVSLTLPLVLDLTWFVDAARAQGCEPPSCREESGGGSQPPQPPPPPEEGGDSHPGEPGKPGNPGEPDGGGDGDAGGDDSSGGNPAAPPGAAGDGSDSGNRGGGGDSYNTYICGVIAYCPELADYTTYSPEYGGSGFLVSFTCRTYESCQGSDGSDGGMEPPCEPTIGRGGVGMVCDGDGKNGFDWGYYLKVWADIPPHRVKRTPFPRGMVTALNEFDLLAEPWISESGGPHFDGDGFFSDKANMPDPVRAEPESGDIKDYQIGVRWRRVGDRYPGFGAVPPHCFDFDDRPWNVESGAPPAACGTPGPDGHVRVVHTYETSSWDKPPNGPRVDLEKRIIPDIWDLESYQVTVPTYWVVEWRDRWYAWEPTGAFEWGDCGCWGGGEPTNERHRRGCVAPPGICINPGEWYGQTGEPEYDWVLHDTGWHGIDLRDYDHPTWYQASYSVISGGDYAGRDWWGGSRQTVPTPILEVQSVLEP
jgi:hypothetical protein